MHAIFGQLYYTNLYRVYSQVPNKQEGGRNSWGVSKNISKEAMLGGIKGARINSWIGHEFRKVNKRLFGTSEYQKTFYC